MPSHSMGLTPPNNVKQLSTAPADSEQNTSACHTPPHTPVSLLRVVQGVGPPGGPQETGNGGGRGWGCPQV